MTIDKLQAKLEHANGMLRKSATRLKRAMNLQVKWDRRVKSYQKQLAKAYNEAATAVVAKPAKVKTKIVGKPKRNVKLK
jgi:hypothetical protein